MGRGLNGYLVCFRGLPEVLKDVSEEHFGGTVPIATKLRTRGWEGLGTHRSCCYLEGSTAADFIRCEKLMSDISVRL